MSYCRFHNTVLALQDCYEHIDDELDGEEAKARKKLIELCVRIAVEDGHKVGQDVDFV
jgi:hypothetical protein